MELAIEIVAALVVGLSLGLLGAGGSILTVPILVYLLGQPPRLAVPESLAIVGLIALAATARYALRREVDWRTACLVALPGMLGALGGAYVAQQLSERTQLLVFAAIVLLAAWRMLRSGARTTSTSTSTSTSTAETPAAERPAVGVALAAGLGVGLLTGIVGVGGGFLLVPALVLALRLPMRTAVPTSLAVIVVNCASGLAKHLWALDAARGAGDEPLLPWRIVIVFAAFGIAGSLAGTVLAARLPQAVLRSMFAWMLVLIGVAVAVAELVGGARS
jgi:uncharacterized membrane protein YfcA